MNDLQNTQQELRGTAFLTSKTLEQRAMMYSKKCKSINCKSCKEAISCKKLLRYESNRAGAYMQKFIDVERAVELISSKEFVSIFLDCYVDGKCASSDVEELTRKKLNSKI